MSDLCCLINCERTLHHVLVHFHLLKLYFGTVLNTVVVTEGAKHDCEERVGYHLPQLKRLTEKMLLTVMVYLANIF